MTIIRQYRDEDRAAVEGMLRAQGFRYELPELNSDSLFITRLVVENEEGKAVQALLGRLTSEAYFLEEPSSASPSVRMRRFLALHSRACEEGREAGVDSVHAWLPPEVSEKFGSQLCKLGWTQYTWPVFMKRL